MITGQPDEQRGGQHPDGRSPTILQAWQSLLCQVRYSFSNCLHHFCEFLIFMKSGTKITAIRMSAQKEWIPKDLETKNIGLK